MVTPYSQRAPFNDWWYWSECLVKRFKTIADIYKENAEAERGSQAEEWAKKLKDNCMVPVMAARKGMKTDEEKENVKKLEETAINQTAAMFRELLVNLPFISSSIQEFLYIDYMDFKWEEDEASDDSDDDAAEKKKKKKKQSDGRIVELFWGPKARQDEGIRSGKVEDGGLPGIMLNLLAAEKGSTGRTPTDYGQVMQAAASQQYTATSSSKVGMAVNFKPGSGI